jgi:SAM-dependent methyltransferase
MSLQLQPRDCVLCGPQAAKHLKYAASFSAEDLTPKIFSARRGPDRKHFQLMRCADCNIVYSDPACDPAQLGGLYAASEVTYGAQEEEIYKSYAPILDQARALTRGRKSFVEVGGGSGFMLRYGQTHGFSRQIEIEPSTQAHAHFKQSGTPGEFICGMFDGASLPKQSASMVCFFQVLDHLSDPKKFLQDIYEVLEPGGVAVGITHNTEALSARLLGRRSPIYDIEHTYLFNLDNIKRIFSAAGFRTVQSQPIANTYSVRYWADLLPTTPGLRRSAQSALRALHLADLPVRLRAGNLAAFGVK